MSLVEQLREAKTDYERALQFESYAESQEIDRAMAYTNAAMERWNSLVKMSKQVYT